MATACGSTSPQPASLRSCQSNYDPGGTRRNSSRVRTRRAIIRAGGLKLIVDGRVYALSRNDDRSKEVNFHGTRTVPTPETSSPYSDDFGDVQRIRGGVPYNDPIFVKAARWLLDQPGIEQLRVFLNDV